MSDLIQILTNYYPHDFAAKKVADQLRFVSKGRERAFTIHEDGYIAAYQGIIVEEVTGERWWNEEVYISRIARGTRDEAGIEWTSKGQELLVEIVDSSDNVVNVFGIGEFLLMQAIIHGVRADALPWNVRYPHGLDMLLIGPKVPPGNFIGFLLLTSNHGEIIPVRETRGGVDVIAVSTGEKKTMKKSEFFEEIDPTAAICEDGYCIADDVPAEIPSLAECRKVQADKAKAKGKGKADKAKAKGKADKGKAGKAGKIAGAGRAGKAGKSAEVRIAEAMEAIATYGDVDGAHHKAWLIDQIASILTGAKSRSRGSIRP